MESRCCSRAEARAQTSCSELAAGRLPGLASKAELSSAQTSVWSAVKLVSTALARVCTTASKPKTKCLRNGSRARERAFRARMAPARMASLETACASGHGIKLNGHCADRTKWQSLEQWL